MSRADDMVDTGADEAEVAGRARQIPVAVVAAETVRVHLGAAQLGMTVGACNAARKDGRWVEGKHWHKAPDGTVWLDIPAIQEWVRTGR